MKLKKSDTDHIKSVGDKWNVALSAATLSVKTNSKLVGLEKIRADLAHCAALKATGCPDHEIFAIGRGYGSPMPEMVNIVEAAFKDAVNAAIEKLTPVSA